MDDCSSMPSAPIIISSVAQLVAICVAIWGVIRWRQELFAKRRIELCEDVLTHLYEVRDAINAIRNPFVWGSEGSSRMPQPGESEQQQENARQAHVYVERVERYRDTFARFNSLRYRFMAIYGEEWANSFQTFVGAVNRVLSAAGTIRRESERHTYLGRRAAELQEQADERIGRAQAIVYQGHTTPDEIDQEINISFQRLEQKCREEIATSASILYQFLRKLQD